MKRDAASRKEAFLVAFGGVMAFIWLLLLPAMMVAKASHMLSWAIGLSFLAALWALMEVKLKAREDEGLESLIDLGWTVFLWSNPIGWSILLVIWGLRKSSWACLLALVALPGVIKEDD